MLVRNSLMGRHTRGHGLGELREADDESDERAEGDDQEHHHNTTRLKHETLDRRQRLEYISNQSNSAKLLN